MGWFLFLWSGREKSPSLRGIETGEGSVADVRQDWG